jgi:phytoene dehydrogenase-like protein
VKFDVVIIGAGLSGLAAGLRAAQFDKRVLVVERHSLWGGLNSFYKKQGRLFDVGLHAMTNYMAPGYRGPRIPLQRLTRQLRIPLQDLDIVPQHVSSTRFDDCVLPWGNGIESLAASVERAFPEERDGFARLAEALAPYPDAMNDRPWVSSRARMQEYIQTPLLREMLLAPLLFYGGAAAHDMDWGQCAILFNSIYREGLCRPKRGMRPFLKMLVERFREAGGEMWTRAPVERLVHRDGRVAEVVVKDRPAVQADVVLSSAGWPETEGLLEPERAKPPVRAEPGQLAFVESIWVLDRDPAEHGYDDAVTFFNAGTEFRWEAPEDDVDLRSGVLCCPNHYEGTEEPSFFAVRATHLAHPRRWFEFDEETYRTRKAAAVEASRRRVEEIVGPFGAEVHATDAFTPRTVHHYTGHVNGAIYGSAAKRPTADIGLDNLFLIGTDQGLVGIVGAMLSGVAVTNAKVLNR